MKTTYKFLLSIIAALIVVAGAWAMQGKKHSGQKFDTYYYKYNPDQANLNLYQNTSSWTQISDPNEESCDGSQIPCVVESDQATVAAFVNGIQTEADVETATIAQKDAVE